LTHFAEFNRCRPDLSVCDYVSHGSSALVHAADDQSVVESLEGLAHVFNSGRAIAADREYRLGLVSIGMRTNPYGASVAPNPHQTRVAMARIDPRQRALFGAAWAVGVMAATDALGISSLALAASVGPFGLLYRRADWPQPVYDEQPNACVYPIFHVFRALLQMADASRVSVNTGVHDVVGIAAEVSGVYRIVVSNLSTERRELGLPNEARVRLLTRETFLSAITEPGWLMDARPEKSASVVLEAYEIAFLDISKDAT
jgi:hypothetical protein